MSSIQRIKDYIPAHKTSTAFAALSLAALVASIACWILLDNFHTPLKQDLPMLLGTVIVLSSLSLIWFFHDVFKSNPDTKKPKKSEPLSTTAQDLISGKQRILLPGMKVPIYFFNKSYDSFFKERQITHTELAEALIQKNHIFVYQTLLELYVWANQPESVRSLLFEKEKTIDINRKVSGESILGMAIRKENLLCAEVLIRWNADITQVQTVFSRVISARQLTSRIHQEHIARKASSPNTIPETIIQAYKEFETFISGEEGRQEFVRFISS